MTSLTFELRGSTAVLTMNRPQARNALDDSIIDLPKDLGRAAGPLAPIVQKIASVIRDRALAPS